MNISRRLPIAVVVVAQLFGASIWFSPNSAADSLASEWMLSAVQLGYLTSAVQGGFILGCLLLATTGLADRFSASRIMALACLCGAGFNAAFAYLAHGIEQGIVLRFFVGVCLAGIYPLGMKMVIGWTRSGAGSVLGLLVGMLTLGTALPHGVRALGANLSWHWVVLTSSFLALLAGTAVLWLGDGPYATKAVRGNIRWGAALSLFADRRFFSCAMGYFGHMWELYAFWTIAPIFVADLVHRATTGPQAALIAGLSFVVIGIGAVGAVAAGLLSRRFGSAKVAALSLAMSGSVCLVYPSAIGYGVVVCSALLAVWGLTVIADSAQFSAIASSSCPADIVGSALAIQNCIGFAITVASISLVTSKIESWGPAVAWLLLPGPVIGLTFFARLVFEAPVRAPQDLR